ncbi:MAG: Ig-like domain repeat protein [Chloroflexi bacterium]|nr:Ig-like domain repeat protein [Chloroflexota bacterium]
MRPDRLRALNLVRARSRGQGFVEYGLVVAAIALIVMIGANNLSGAEKAYFGAIGPSLAPAAPTYAPIGAPTVMTVATVTGTYGGTVTLTATLRSSGTGVSGKTLSFMLNGTPVCGGTTGVTCPTTNSSGVATLSSVSLGSIDAGTYTTGIVAQFQGDANYGMSTGTGTLIVNAAAQSITFTQPPSPAGYQSTFSVAPTASSGLQTVVSASGGCTAAQAGSSYTITMTSSTTACMLTATQPGNTDYSAATPVTVTVAATKAQATITITNTSQTYNGSPRAVTVATNPTGLAYTLTYSGGPNPPTNAGSYPVSVTINDTNYQGTQTATLVVSQAPATVTLSNLSATYNASPHPVTVSTSPAGLTTSITYNGSSTAPTNAGTYTVNASVTDPNYQGSTNGTLTVTPATTNVIVDAKTVASQKNSQVTLTASVYASGATPVPVENQGTVTFAVSGNPCSSIAPSPVNVGATGAVTATCTFSKAPTGPYTISATYTPDALANFSSNSGSATMTVVANGAKNTNLTASPVHGGVAGGPVTLTATLTDIHSAGVAGKSIVFSVNGTAACGGAGPACPTTNASGVASLTINLGPMGSSTYPITASWAGDGTDLASNATSRLTVD